MGRSRFLLLPFLFVALLLSLSVSNVCCSRKLLEETAISSSVQAVPEESWGKSRLMIELMDYSDPEPNINPRTGVLLNPPPSPSPPSPSVGS